MKKRSKPLKEKVLLLGSEGRAGEEIPGEQESLHKLSAMQREIREH